ncbi:ribosomal protein L4 domain-containing protein [Podospora aff. communis PSN243]|uniref:Large ribosomal subunit protein uL4m n=1 Tax=Podospora aff. communis PSN243 TaxID=3040156 RepID=A0AAV9GY64_9PEZI|nr:ribosomal protein L4 domain-containing protein [Podospora aff. communis PSN243]
MAGKGLRSLSEAMRGLSLASQTCRTLPTRSVSLTCRRSMASEAPVANITRSVTDTWEPVKSVPLTIYSFPSLEPRSLESWSAKHLHLPLRRDILHLAVVYEGDKTRQGTASSKTRWEVAGSHRKMLKQKGSGRARRGTRQSPLLRGGGKSFGPKPRDFSTSLNRKVYDLAWRTALSYRYRRGELIVTEDGMDLPLPEDFLQLAEAGSLGQELEDGFVKKYLAQMLSALHWDRKFGRTTFITGDRRPNLFTGTEVAAEDARALELEDVDVKDLLETGRLVIERSALKEMIKKHQSDLVSNVVVNGLRHKGPESGKLILR